MKRQNALSNPTIEDIARLSEEYNDQEVKQVEGQLKLPINKDNSLGSFITRIKIKLKKRLEVIEISQFWKSPAIPFYIVMSILNILLLLIGGLFLFGSLPTKIQLFYDPISRTWADEDKIDKFVAVFILPIILVCIFLIQYKFISIIFRKDRRLAQTIAWVMTFLNFCLLIAISQIYNLIS